MKNDSSYVTFIMPAYNVEDFIEDAVDSICRQTVPEWELIIIDDGATDKTPEIISFLSKEDPRISILTMESPSGSAYQPRKKGICAARSEFVAPLDADDAIEPEYLAKLTKRLKETDADIIYPVMYKKILKEEQRIIPQDTDLMNKILEGKDCVNLTLDGWKINCNGGLIRKSVYEKAFSRYDSSLTYSNADELLTRQLFLLNPRVAFCEARYYYTDNPDSITRKKSLKLFDFLTNNINLNDLILKNFGSDSREYINIQRQNLLGIYDALRLMEKYGFDRSGRNEIFSLLKKNISIIDDKVLRGNVSKKLRYLIKTGLPTTAIITKWHDRFITKQP